MISESDHHRVITVWANLVFARIQWIIYNWQGTPDAPRWAITRIAPTTSGAARRDDVLRWDQRIESQPGNHRVGESCIRPYPMDHL